MTELLLGNLNYSSWSIRAALVARMSGLDIQETVRPLLAKATHLELVERTGYRQVPALIDGALAIRDSLAITEWIAEQASPGMVWPIDQAARARARMVVAEMHSSFAALRAQCWVDIRARRTDTALSKATEVDIARILAIWAECRQGSAPGGPFLFGRWSAADAFYAPVVTRFRTYGIALDGADADYTEAVLNHPDMLAIEAAAQAEPWILALGENGMQYVGDQP